MTTREDAIRADERSKLAQKYGNGYLNLHRYCRCAQGGTYPGCPVHGEDWEQWTRADERAKALNSLIDVPIGAHWQGVCGHHWDYQDHKEVCPICGERERVAKEVEALAPFTTHLDDCECHDCVVRNVTLSLARIIRKQGEGNGSDE